MKKIFVVFLLAVFVLSCACVVFAETKTTAKKVDNAQKLNPDQQVIVNATEVFKNINNSFEQGIPRGLVYTAQAIAIFPKTSGGAFIVGGMGGRGVILYKQKNLWSPPAFLRISSASIGFQAGFKETDIVLVLMNKNQIDGLLKSKIKLGVDAGVAAGPAGRDADIGTDIQAKGVIYSYSKSRGAYVGVNLEGSSITPDETANKAVYGKSYTTEDIILKGKVKPTKEGKELINVIDDYTKK